MHYAFFFTNVLENKGICKSQTADSQITHINKYVSQKMMGNCHERRDVIECCLEYLCLLVSTHCTGEQASSNMLSIGLPVPFLTAVPNLEESFSSTRMQQSRSIRLKKIGITSQQEFVQATNYATIYNLYYYPCYFPVQCRVLDNQLNIGATCDARPPVQMLTFTVVSKTTMDTFNNPYLIIQQLSLDMLTFKASVCDCLPGQEVCSAWNYHNCPILHIFVDPDDLGDPTFWLLHMPRRMLWSRLLGFVSLHS